MDVSPPDRNTGDTDPTALEPAPLPPPPPVGPPRAKRNTVGSAARRALVVVLNAIGKHADKVVTAVMALVLSLVLAWTQRIDTRADHAENVAGVAAAQGAAGATVATKAKAETQATYDATKEKVDASGQVIADLAAKVDALTAEVEKLKAAKAGRPRRRPPAVKVPAAVTQPLPVSPAAAVKEAAAAPGAKP